jgi:hypothetical protein
MGPPLTWNIVTNVILNGANVTAWKVNVLYVCAQLSSSDSERKTET